MKKLEQRNRSMKGERRRESNKPVRSKCQRKVESVKSVQTMRKG